MMNHSEAVLRLYWICTTLQVSSVKANAANNASFDSSKAERYLQEKIDDLQQFIEKVRSGLEKQFPGSHVIVRQSGERDIIAHVDGVKVFDMERILSLLGEMPIPGKEGQSEG